MIGWAHHKEQKILTVVDAVEAVMRKPGIHKVQEIAPDLTFSQRERVGWMLANPYWRTVFNEKIAREGEV